MVNQTLSRVRKTSARKAAWHRVTELGSLKKTAMRGESWPGKGHQNQRRVGRSCMLGNRVAQGVGAWVEWEGHVGWGKGATEPLEIYYIWGK